VVVGIRSGTERPAYYEQTFLELYNLEAIHVLRYLHAAVRDYGAAEELASETFLRAWQAWPRFEHRGVAPRSWLFRIARNLVIDHARKRRPVIPLADVVPDQRSESTATTATDRVLLAEALQRVSRADRELLLLRSVGLTHAEIGKVQGRSEKAVKVAWFRAVHRLRAELGEEVGDHG
jgi:RNA polymerase sigma-70 factor (ECF subfamily)